MISRRLHQPVLCLITDRKICGYSNIHEIVGLAVQGGVNMVQIREKDMSSKDMLVLVKELTTIIDGRALLLVNERLDVAIASKVDGVHLGEDSFHPSVAREIVGQSMLVGRSIHSVSGAMNAQAQGADYVIAGSIFQTNSHPDVKPMGVQFLKELHVNIGIPYIAVGGILDSNIPNVMELGAHGIAVIGAIFDSASPREAAQNMRIALDNAWKTNSYAGQD